MMRFVWYFPLLLGLMVLTGCALPERRGPVIFAASSLQAPLEDIASQWQAQGRDAPVLSFASSAALARQIESGAPADIFISADSQWTDFIATSGKIEARSIRTIAANGLVVAASTRDQPIAAQGKAAAQSALASARSIATGDPDTVPLGRYAQEALTALGLWDRVQPRVIPAGSAQAALRLVLLGEADIGILYASDAARRDDLGVIWQMPKDHHTPITYRALRLPGSAHPDADAFLDYLTTPKAAGTFDRMGFARP